MNRATMKRVKAWTQGRGAFRRAEWIEQTLPQEMTDFLDNEPFVCAWGVHWKPSPSNFRQSIYYLWRALLNGRFARSELVVADDDTQAANGIYSLARERREALETVKTMVAGSHNQQTLLIDMGH